MKNAIYWIIALIAAYFVYKLVIGLFASVVSLAITIGLILFFGWLVVSIYKAMTKQKSIL